MRDRVEVAAQISVHHFSSPAQQRNLDRVDGLLRPPLWSVGEAVLVEVGFKDGQEQQHHRCLHHPVSNRRDSQRPFLSIRLRDIHPTNRTRAIGFPSQLGFEFRKP